MRNVLIIDADLGFVFWLGQSLDAAGYETLPAKGISEAIALLEELQVVIDVLMVGSRLHGAATFATQLRAAQGGHLKTIALIDENDERTESLADWDGWQRKPHIPDESARKIFLKLLQSVLAPGTALSSK